MTVRCVLMKICREKPFSQVDVGPLLFLPPCFSKQEFQFLWDHAHLGSCSFGTPVHLGFLFLWDHLHLGFPQLCLH